MSLPKGERVKGTRLWQAPGSPIIQGRSRTERPFWERWLKGVAGAELLVFVGATLVALRAADLSLGRALVSAAFSAMLLALPGCLAGAAIGVWVSRTMGWRRHWMVGAVAGAVLGFLTIAFF